MMLIKYAIYKNILYYTCITIARGSFSISKNSSKISQEYVAGRSVMFCMITFLYEQEFGGTQVNSSTDLFKFTVGKHTSVLSANLT